MTKITKLRQLLRIAREAIDVALWEAKKTRSSLPNIVTPADYTDAHCESDMTVGYYEDCLKQMENRHANV